MLVHTHSFLVPVFFYLTLARTMASLLHKDIKVMSLKDWLAAVLYATQVVIELVTVIRNRVILLSELNITLKFVSR